MTPAAKKVLNKIEARMNEQRKAQNEMLEAIRAHYPNKGKGKGSLDTSEDGQTLTDLAQAFVRDMLGKVENDNGRGVVSLGGRLALVESFIREYAMTLPSDSEFYSGDGREKVLGLAFGVGEAAGLPTEAIDCAWEVHAPAYAQKKGVQ